MVIYSAKYTKYIYSFIVLIMGMCNTYGQFNTPSVSVRGKIISKNVVPGDTNESMRVNTDTLEENKPDFLSSPLDSLYVTSHYGNRYHPIKEQWIDHKGIDLRGKDKPVYAGITGFVSELGYNAELGMFVKITIGELELIYGHLSHLYVSDGQLVKVGEMIARTGESGSTTAKHLHFAIKVNGDFVDPILFLDYFLE